MSNELEEIIARTGHDEVMEVKNNIPWLFRLGSNRELVRLVEHLHDDERLLSVVTGVYGGGKGLLALTDSRLLFVYDGWMNKKSEGFPLQHVSSIEYSKKWFRSEIRVMSTGSGETRISKIYYGANDLVTRGRNGIRSAKNGGLQSSQDITTKQKYLDDLAQRGVISISNYQEERRRLLNS